MTPTDRPSATGAIRLLSILRQRCPSCESLTIPVGYEDMTKEYREKQHAKN
jgi:hypothetical protein